MALAPHSDAALTIRRALALLSLIALAAWPLLTACGPPAPAKPAPPPLTIHTDVDALYLEPLIRRFEEEHEVPIEVFYTLDEDLAAAQQAAGDGALPAGALRGDVVIARDSHTLAALADAGLLTGLPAEAPYTTLDARFRETTAEGKPPRWVGLCWRLMVLVHRKDLEVPSSAKGLDQLAGKLAWPHAGEATLQSTVASWIATHGKAEMERVLTAFAADGARARPYRDLPALRAILTRMTLDAAVRRDAPTAALVDYDLWIRHISRNPGHGQRLSWRPLDPRRAAWTLTAAGIRKDPQMPERAEAFVRLALSDTESPQPKQRGGQQTLTAGDNNFRGNYQFPVRKIEARNPSLQGMWGQLDSGDVVPGPTPATIRPHRPLAAEWLRAGTLPLKPKK